MIDFYKKDCCLKDCKGKFSILYKSDSDTNGVKCDACDHFEERFNLKSHYEFMTQYTKEDNNGITWQKPYAFLDNKGEHKTCWQCENIRIARQFMRKCLIHTEKYILAGDGEYEFFETGKTIADECLDYRLDEEHKEKYK